MEENQDLLKSELVVDGAAYEYLRESGKWSRFLGIVGFVFSALIVIVALFAGSAFSALSGFGSAGLMGAGMIMFIYLLVGVISFFMSLFLYRFGTKVKEAFQATEQELLNVALMNLKNYFKLLGIITVIYLALIALMFLGGILIAAFR